MSKSLYSRSKLIDKSLKNMWSINVFSFSHQRVVLTCPCDQIFGVISLWKYAVVKTNPHPNNFSTFRFFGEFFFVSEDLLTLPQGCLVLPMKRRKTTRLLMKTLNRLFPESLGGDANNKRPVKISDRTNGSWNVCGDPLLKVPLELNVSSNKK